MTTIRNHIVGETKLTYWVRDPAQPLATHASELISEWQSKAKDCRDKKNFALTYCGGDQRFAMTSISCDAAIDTAALLLGQYEAVQYQTSLRFQYHEEIVAFRASEERRRRSRLFRFVSWLTGIPL